MIQWQFFPWQFVCGGTLTFVLLYFVIDSVLARRDIAKLPGLPPVGTPWPFTPRIVSNSLFAWDAASLLQRGYRRFKTSAFQLVQNDKNVIVLPLSVLEELVAIPPTVASPHGGLENDLLGSYTGLDLVLESRLHHSIIQRKLTPRLGLVTPGLEKELCNALAECLPNSEDWAVFQPYQAFSKVSARFSSQAITGPAFANNEEWLTLGVEYVESLFQTIVCLRFLPRWTRPVACWLLPPYWYCNGYLRRAKHLLGPKIQELLAENDSGRFVPQDNDEQHINVLSWLIDSARGRDRNPATISHVMVILALASVHTVLLRIVNIIYDVTAHPELLGELRAEIDSVARNWQDAPYERLHKLDSVLIESQRTSPPTTTGLKRIFLAPYTFQNGLHIPKGAYVCMPIYAIENDPAHTADPEVFDGLRQYRLSAKEEGSGGPGGKSKTLTFSSTTPTRLNFGYGRAACPGRFFAELELKMLFVKLLCEYEFKFLPGAGRPANMMLHEFLFTWPWTKMFIRRRKAGAAPF